MTHQPQQEPWKCYIAIEGAGAEELFCAGPEDLRDYFFKEWANIQPQDIKAIKFTRVTERDELGLATKWEEHKENFDLRRE